VKFNVRFWAFAYEYVLQNIWDASRRSAILQICCSIGHWEFQLYYSVFAKVLELETMGDAESIDVVGFCATDFATALSVRLSVYRLSHSCIPLQPLDEMRFYLEVCHGLPCGPSIIVLDRSRAGRGGLGSEANQWTFALQAARPNRHGIGGDRCRIAPNVSYKSLFTA